MDRVVGYATGFVELLAYSLSGWVRRRPDMYVFGAWEGNRYADNCRFLFEYLAQMKPDLDLVWIGNEDLEGRVAAVPNVRFIQRRSWAAIWACVRAGTCFMSHGYVDVCVLPVLRGSRTVYLGHGIAIKNMGAGPIEPGGTFKRSLRALWRSPNTIDYWPASSQEHAEKLRVENQRQLVDPSKILRTGQPRLDPLFQSRRDRSARRLVRQRLNERHGLPADATLISYLPTFRDSGQPVFSFLDLGGAERSALTRVLKEGHAWIAAKSHQAEASASADRADGAPGWLLDLAAEVDLDTQDLLIATDILITDYSGCYIDFLVLDRPVVHFAYDYQEYLERDRGMYYPLEEIAGGDVATTVGELVESLKANLQSPARDARKRQALFDRLLGWEDGTAGVRTAEFLLGDTGPRPDCMSARDGGVD